MPEIQVQQYSSNYLDDLISVWESASKVGHPFLKSDFLASEKKNIPLVYLPDGDAWIALLENRVVGFTILHGDEVGALFVNPEFHGQGVGYALMNKVAALHSELKVEVFKDNHIGTAFYSRYGFNQVSEYHHAETGMLMLCLEYKNN